MIVEKSELLPFSRNRYYSGKMLTSVDFEAEQRYMNHKRRFINQMIGGSGIVCGLNVISLDDLSIMVESGVALDDMGREIVAESSVVKKLSALSGFETLSSEEVSLCIRYMEREAQPVYAVGRQDDGQEFAYNRIEEGYELFLQDKALADKEFEVETEFYTGGVLFENDEYRICMRIPGNISAGYFVRIAVEAKKLSAEASELLYHCVLHTPVLTTVDGAHELEVKLDGIRMEQGEKTVQEYWMLAQMQPYDDSSILVKTQSAKAFINGAECVADTGLTCKINIVPATPQMLAAREASRVSMELRSMGVHTGGVRLADMKLVRTETAYLIESVDETARKYVLTMRDTWNRMEYNDCFLKPSPLLTVKTDSTDAFLQEKGADFLHNMTKRIATGIVEIPIGEHARKGTVCYSGEIMHGLGTGNVYVAVGHERIEENEMLGKSAKTTVFGNPNLFDPDSSQVSAEMAVKVLNDKGSFVVALKLRRNVRMLVLTYRWIAVKSDSEKLTDEFAPDRMQSISVVTPTVVLGTRERYFFQVVCNHMKDCSVSYELTEAGSGEISSDGIYTAPAKEGVYEIRIYCTEKPFLCTYAYAIVKQKSAEE